MHLILLSGEYFKESHISFLGVNFLKNVEFYKSFKSNNLTLSLKTKLDKFILIIKKTILEKNFI